MDNFRQPTYLLSIALILLGISSIKYSSLISSINTNSYILLGCAFILITTLYFTDKTVEKVKKRYYAHLIGISTSVIYITASLINNLAPDRGVISWLKMLPAIAIIIYILIRKSRQKSDVPTIENTVN